MIFGKDIKNESYFNMMPSERELRFQKDQKILIKHPRF